MWTSQVFGHHDKMARTKTHRTSQNTEYTKTQQPLRNKYCFVFFGFFCFYFIFNFQLLKRLLQKKVELRSSSWMRPVFCVLLYMRTIILISGMFA